MPPKPPLVLATALSGGLLPCLERLVRRTGEAFRPGACGKLLRVVAVDALPKEGTRGAPTACAKCAAGDVVFLRCCVRLNGGRWGSMWRARTAPAADGCAGRVRVAAGDVGVGAGDGETAVGAGAGAVGADLGAAARPLGAESAGRLPERVHRLAPNGTRGCTNGTGRSAASAGVHRSRGGGPGCVAAGVASGEGDGELVGACMRLVAYLLCGGGLQDPHDRAVWILPVRQLLVAARRLALYSPGEVRRALAVRPAAGVPAHCTWSSEVVGELASGLPAARLRGPVVVLGYFLTAWERGQLVLPPPPGDDDDGLLVTLRAEVAQQCPLRRCSWWRCTHLAGDSEAGVERSKCGGCGGEWY